MTDPNAAKRDAAIKYLRARNIYATDLQNKLRYKHGSDAAQAARAEERRIKEAEQKPANVSPIMRRTK